MANQTSNAQPVPGRPPRVAFYIVLGIMALIAVIAARIMGMPRGVGVQHEPEESAPASQH